MKELQYLNKYFIKYKYRFLLGIVIATVAQIFMLYTPNLIGEAIKIIENFQKHQNTFEFAKNQLIIKLLKIIVVTVIAGFLTFIMRQILIVNSRNIEFELKNEVFQHYENLDQNFYKRN